MLLFSYFFSMFLRFNKSCDSFERHNEQITLDKLEMLSFQSSCSLNRDSIKNGINFELCLIFYVISSLDLYYIPNPIKHPTNLKAKYLYEKSLECMKLPINCFKISIILFCIIVRYFDYNNLFFTKSNEKKSNKNIINNYRIFYHGELNRLIRLGQIFINSIKRKSIM
jgi:hypothetical protein